MQVTDKPSNRRCCRDLSAALFDASNERRRPKPRTSTVIYAAAAEAERRARAQFNLTAISMLNVVIFERDLRVMMPRKMMTTMTVTQFT